jgi:hypothetical protein
MSRSCTFSPPMCLHGVYRDHFTFFLLPLVFSVPVRCQGTRFERYCHLGEDYEIKWCSLEVHANNMQTSKWLLYNWIIIIVVVDIINLLTCEDGQFYTV